MVNYHINIFHSDEDDGSTADILDLPGCCAFGESPEQALNEVLNAKRLWIESAMADGADVPLPKFRPAIYQTVS